MNQLGASTWLKTLSQEDALSFLPEPTGRGMMVCGRKALGRINQLAHTAIRNSDAAGTLSVERVDANLRRILVSNFLSNNLPVDVDHVNAALTEAVNAAKQERADTTHYIPCRLSSATTPNQFAVGPVLFRTRQTFSEVVDPLIEEIDNRHATGGGNPKLYRTRIEEYYHAFDWAAEVTVLNCDAEISEERARRAVGAAIDMLQVILGPHHARRMMAGGHARPHDGRAHLRLDAKGRPSMSYQWQSTSPVALDNLAEILANQSIVALLENAGRSIKPIVDASLSWPISRRLVEAASWYGQAVREEFEAARIVKAVTALEHLLITNKKERKRSTIVNRGAALAIRVDDSADVAEWKGRLKRAYKLRSDLVHGSLSPFDAEVHQRSSWCVWMCAEILRSALVGFAAGLDKDISDARLAVWFEKLVETPPAA